MKTPKLLMSKQDEIDHLKSIIDNLACLKAKESYVSDAFGDYGLQCIIEKMNQIIVNVRNDHEALMLTGITPQMFTMKNQEDR